MLITAKIDYVNEPKQPGWSASLKTSNKEFISIKPAEMSLFRPGQTYTMEIVETAKNGKIYKNFVRLADQAATVQPVSTHVQHLVQTTAPQPASATTTPYAPPHNFPGNHYADADQVAKDKHIWCTGVVGRAMGSGHFGYDDILPLAEAAAKAFDAIFGG